MKDKKMIMKDVNKVFDCYITFQKKVEPIGPILPLDEYENHIGLWAESRFLKGKNLYAARSANIKTDVEFIIRYRTDLDETMRIKFDNEFYNIESILPLDNNKMYLIIKTYNIKHDM